jgi:phosphatidylinositol alpha-1,6-mannosyltransferase
MKILFSCMDFTRSNLRKQPWRYIYENARSLLKTGFEVVLITNGSGEKDIDGIKIVRVNKLFRPLIGETREFIKAVKMENPDKIVMLMGMTSFLRLNFDFDKPVYGILTSPIYAIRELIINVGCHDIMANIDTLKIHFINAMLPSFFVRHWQKRIEKVIVLSEWNKGRAIDKGIDEKKIIVIPPGLDHEWLENGINKALPKTIGMEKAPTIVYFTSPLGLRGTMDLVKAFSLVVQQTNARLKFICRIDSEDSIKQIMKLKSLAIKEDVIDHVDFVEANLSIDELMVEIGMCTLVCIPFKIVISDVPLSLLESMAIKKPVITTIVASIPEIVREGGLCVRPNNPAELSDAIIDILRNDMLAERLGYQGYGLMTQYPGWDDISKQFESMLKGNGVN